MRTTEGRGTTAGKPRDARMRQANANSTLIYEALARLTGRLMRLTELIQQAGQLHEPGKLKLLDANTNSPSPTEAVPGRVY